MKTTNTPEQLALIETALAKMHVRPFQTESSDAKYNAQRNLTGKTHYVDADTLRWHKSRVLGSGCLANGLLFYIAESCAKDMNNTSRGFRYVVFDVFGSTVNRPTLDDCRTTRKWAKKAFEAQEIDVSDYYREALANKLSWEQGELQTMADAVAMLQPQPAVKAA